MDNEPTDTRTRRTSIRTKLLVGLAVPVLFVALLSGVQAKHAQDDLGRTQRQVTLALAAGGPSTYITALLDERNISALTLLNSQNTVKLTRVKTVAQARANTDKAQAAFGASIKRDGGLVEQLYGPTFTSTSAALAKARAEYDSFHGTKGIYEGPAQQASAHVYDNFSGFIASYAKVNATASAKIDDAEMRNRAQAIAAQTQASNLISLLARQAAQQILNGNKPLDGQQKLDTATLIAEYHATRQSALDNLQNDPRAQAQVGGFYFRPSMGFLDQQMIQAATVGYVGTGPGDIPGVLEVLTKAADTSRPNDNDAWQAARSSLERRAATLTAASRNTRNLYVGIFIFATLISLAFALAISRSIAKPLMSIAAQAHSMATKGLPEAVGSVLATPIGEDIVEPKLEPIVVSSRDEVRDVARSINDVQQRALQLAVEQAMQRRNFADSFLNLGRRVQGLVARQLDFITDLERTEEDEQVLENLFKLDHLATRIRRNAESLIVLAGVTRQRRAGQPAPVIDALRSALSEVDEYTRVTIGNVDEARLPTSVAADLAHILAELIENGLNFSPPTTTVDVSGRRLTDGYEITIVDHGIGMTPEQVETANRRLSGQESFTVAPSRYMGHFVAGHLATGLGISVELRSDADGTTATVTIGERLLARSRSARTASAPAAAAESSPSTVAAPAVASPTTAAASPQGSDLESLLGVHRRLSNPEPADTPDKSPWAQSADTEASGDDQS